jgi:hypothetical protein
MRRPVRWERRWSSRWVLSAALIGGSPAAIALSSESLLPAIGLHVLIDLRSLLLTPGEASVS